MENKINEMKKPALDLDKTVEEPKSPSRKTSIDLWSKIPLLIFLSVICTNGQDENLYWSSVTDLFKLIPFSMVLALFLLYSAYSTLIDNKRVVKSLRSLYSALGVLIVVYCIIKTGKHAVDEFSFRSPFYYYRTQYYDVSWQKLLDAALFVAAGLVVNFCIMVITSGSCLNNEDEEEKDYKHETWQQKLHSIARKLIIVALVVAVCLKLTTTFATAVTNIFYWSLRGNTVPIFGSTVAILRILWIVVFFLAAIIELFAFRHYWKKMNDCTAKISTSYSTV